MMREIVVRNEAGNYLGMYGWGVRHQAIYFPDRVTASDYVAQKAKGAKVIYEAASPDAPTGQHAIPDFNPFSAGRRE